MKTIHEFEIRRGVLSPSMHRFELSMDQDIMPLSCNEDFTEAKRDFLLALEDYKEDLNECITAVESMEREVKSD